jgi:hypothetical protein
MQQIMNNELKNGYLLKYEETFNKEKVIFENTKVILLTLLLISCQILRVCLFFF